MDSLAESTHIKGRVVVVTGGTGALGAALVGRLLQAGAELHLPVLDPQELQGQSWFTVRVHEGVDLRDAAQVADFYAGFNKLWGSVHFVGGALHAPIQATSAEDFRRIWELNTTTSFLCTQAAIARMRARIRPKGRVVNISTQGSLRPRGGAVAYDMAKAAINTMTTALSEELLGEEILLNTLALSMVDTPMNRRAHRGVDHTQWLKPLDVARSVEMLLSPSNTCVRGAVLPVYGRY